MSRLNHDFFGLIDTEKDLDAGLGEAFSGGIGVLWEEECDGITATLWYDKAYELKAEVLDIFADFLKHFEVYEEKARLALVEYLKEDDEYIIFHKDELELDVPGEVTEFVEKIEVSSIALWAGEDFISIDFMIDREESDEILCVKFNHDLALESTVWES